MNFTNEQQESLMRIVMTRVGEAITNGNNPFAAILVDAGGNILYSAYNIAAPQTDILGHAELQLIREAAKQHGIVELDTYALFTNAASCAMTSITERLLSGTQIRLLLMNS
jgi:tRNA(Arg) A34 adenosine deaminase TadA